MDPELIVSMRYFTAQEAAPQRSRLTERWVCTFSRFGCLVPFAGFTPRGRRWWIRWAVALVLYAYGVETIQTLRGLDARFSHRFMQIDQIAASLFSLVAIGQIAVARRRPARSASDPDHSSHLHAIYAVRPTCQTVDSCRGAWPLTMCVAAVLVATCCFHLAYKKLQRQSL